MPPKRFANNTRMDASVLPSSGQNMTAMCNTTIGMNSTLALRTSRSGRTIIPRLKTWTGERVMVTKTGTLQYFEGGLDLTGMLENVRPHDYIAGNYTLQHFTIMDCQIVSQTIIQEELLPPKKAPRRRQKQATSVAEVSDTSCVVAAAGSTSRNITERSVHIEESSAVVLLDSSRNSTAEETQKKRKKRRARLTMPRGRKPAAQKTITALVPVEGLSDMQGTRGTITRKIQSSASKGETTLTTARKIPNGRHHVLEDSYQVGTLGPAPTGRGRLQKTATTTVSVNQFTVTSRSNNLTSDSAYLSMATPGRSISGRSNSTRQMHHLSDILEESTPASPLVASSHRGRKKNSLTLAIAAMPATKSRRFRKKPLRYETTDPEPISRGPVDATPRTGSRKVQTKSPSPAASPIIGRKPRRLLSTTTILEENAPPSPVLNGTLNRTRLKKTPRRAPLTVNRSANRKNVETPRRIPAKIVKDIQQLGSGHKKETSTRGRKPKAQQQVNEEGVSRVDVEVRPTPKRRKKADVAPEEKEAKTTKTRRITKAKVTLVSPSPQCGRKRKSTSESEPLINSTGTISEGKIQRKKGAGSIVVDRVADSPKKAKQVKPDEVFLKPVALPPSKSRSKKTSQAPPPPQGADNANKRGKTALAKAHPVALSLNNSALGKSIANTTLTSQKRSKLPFPVGHGSPSFLGASTASLGKRAGRTQQSPVLQSKAGRNKRVDDSCIDLPSTSNQRPRTVKERQLQMRNLQCPLESDDSSDGDGDEDRSSLFARPRPNIFGGPTKQIAAMLDISSSDSDDNLSIRTSSSPYSSRSNVSMTSVVNTSERLSDDFELDRINDSRSLAEKLVSYGHNKVLHRQLKTTNGMTTQQKLRSAPSATRLGTTTKGKSLAVRPAAPKKKPFMEYSCLYAGNKVDVSCWDVDTSDEESESSSAFAWMDPVDD